MEVIGVNKQYIFKYYKLEDIQLGNTHKFPGFFFFVVFELQ
jgi:hypothetical protein